MTSPDQDHAWPASVTRALELIADRWTALIISRAFLGPFRFDELHANLGISRNTLARRLDVMLNADLLTRRPYQTRPVRYDYLLTAKGGELYGVFTAIKRWGDTWLTQPDDTRLDLWHRPCGHPVRSVVACEHCGLPLAIEDMDYTLKSPSTSATRRRSKSGATATPRSD